MLKKDFVLIHAIDTVFADRSDLIVEIAKASESSFATNQFVYACFTGPYESIIKRCLEQAYKSGSIEDMTYADRFLKATANKVQHGRNILDNLPLPKEEVEKLQNIVEKKIIALDSDMLRKLIVKLGGDYIAERIYALQYPR
jgi:hypothetical protein